MQVSYDELDDYYQYDEYSPIGEFIKIFKKNNEYYNCGKKIINLIQNSDDYYDTVKKDPQQLIFIDKTTENYLELCKLAVQNCGYMIQSIPLEYITEELCILAIKQEPESILVINNKILTEEMCKLAFELKYYTFKNIPDKYRSYEMCVSAIKKAGHLLHYIKEQFHNEELCKLAVENDGYSIRYVSKPFYTKEMCELAVKRNGLALSFIENKFRNYELYELAVENCGNAIRYVPNKYKTENLCKIAVQSKCHSATGSVLAYIPLHFINFSEEIYKKCINRDEYEIQFIPEHHLTQELCDLAYGINKHTFMYIPERFKHNLINSSKL